MERCFVSDRTISLQQATQYSEQKIRTWGHVAEGQWHYLDSGVWGWVLLLASFLLYTWSCSIWSFLNFLPHPTKPASFGISISDPLFLQTEKNYTPECQNQMVTDRVGWMKSSGKSTYVHTVGMARGFLNFSDFCFGFWLMTFSILEILYNIFGSEWIPNHYYHRRFEYYGIFAFWKVFCFILGLFYVGFFLC